MRWDEFGDAVGGESDVPAVVVQDVMVEGAHQDAVVEVGGAAVGPSSFGVVADAPVWWSVAAGEDAAFVAVGQGSALLSVEQASGSAVIQW